jgi:hypothetical protein
MSRPILRSLGLVKGLVLTLSVLLASARSQGADHPAPVHMIVTVEAHNGASLPPLKASDVIATQGSTRLRVTEVTACQGENAAMELFLVLDDASSPSGWRLDDLRRFINDQPATASIAIGHMHNGMVETTVKFTLDHALVAQSLRLPLGAGAASPYLALSDLIKHWQGHADRREVVLITSGIDPTGGNGPVNPYLDTAIADAQREGIIVHTIYIPGLGGAAGTPYPLSSGQSFLEQLTTATGGRTFVPVSNRADSLRPVLDDLAQLLDHQYRVTLEPKSGEKAGLKDVKLAIETPHVGLLYAKRMYVTDGR